MSAKPRTFEQMKAEAQDHARKELAAFRKSQRTRQRPYYRLTPFMKSIKPLTSRPNKRNKGTIAPSFAKEAPSFRDSANPE